VSDGSERATLGRMQHPVRGLLHGSAAVASIGGGVALWMQGGDDLAHQLPLLTFTFSLVALYTVSTLYHSIPWRAVWKWRMQRIDHAMIYVLVAGTYTPIAMIVLAGWLGWVTLAIVWGIAAFGILQKIAWPHVGPGLSVTLQTVQGWLAILLLAPLAQRLPAGAIALMALGGVLYSVGLVSFVTHRPRLWPRVFSYHEVFHVFVVAGSSMHWLFMLQYVATFPA
jgi:hemolysin III